MASNPLWRQPLSVWKKYFTTWISEPGPDAVLNSLVMFDFRPLYGKSALAEDLRNHLKAMIDGQGIFFGHMANMILKTTPPVGFFRSFVVEKSGEHKDEFNLKVKGIAPMVDAIRFFALEKGIGETSTSERINALKDRHTVVKEYAAELEHAFEFIMLLKIRHQFEQIKGGAKPDNFINPDSLSNLEKKTLKEAFHLISKLQGVIFEMYKSFIR
jgi:CBS domain-containing protein